MAGESRTSRCITAVRLLDTQPAIGQSARVPTVLEFWPEYSGGPLWSEYGRTVELESVGLSRDLIGRLTAWNARYDDAKLPFEENDRDWLNEGTGLLAEVRTALGTDYVVVVTEPWWGEEPSA